MGARLRETVRGSAGNRKGRDEALIEHVGAPFAGAQPEADMRDLGEALATACWR